MSLPHTDLPPENAGAVDVEQVTRSFGSGLDTVQALGPIDLRVEPGEFLVLVGASGCGKSTLLRLIGGLDVPTSGTIEVGDGPANPGHNVGVVFQQPRLLPWRTVIGNIELALRYAGVPRHDRRARSQELIDRVGLPDVARRRVWEISGGQQQRVAIARALAAPTPVLLLDEPFAALDALTRERLQDDIRRVSLESGRATIFVTHSPEEAAVLGTRVVVLSPHPGRIFAELRSPLARDVDGAQLREQLEFNDFRSTVASTLRQASQEAVDADLS